MKKQKPMFMKNEESWIHKHPILTTIIIIFALILIASFFIGNNSNTDYQSETSSDINSIQPKVGKFYQYPPTVYYYRHLDFGLYDDYRRYDPYYYYPRLYYPQQRYQYYRPQTLVIPSPSTTTTRPQSTTPQISQEEKREKREKARAIWKARTTRQRKKVPATRK